MRILPRLFLVAGMLMTCATGVLAQERRPNVLLLYADDLRRDFVGAFGGREGDTPNLDRLAARGTRLTGISCMGSRHGAVCVPSRAMLLSGRGLPRVTDDLKDAAGNQVPTLPELLREAGYRTFMTGKWHNGKPAAERAFPDAVGVFLGGMCDHNDVPLVDIEDGQVVRQRRGEGHSSRLFADEAVNFLDRRKAAGATDQPFFAYVAFTAPHDPRDPPPGALRRAAEGDRPEVPPNFRGQHGLDLGKPTMAVRDEQLLGWPRDPDLLRDQLQEYRALVMDLDEQIGRILTCLDGHGWLQDTLVVFASDHGLALGSHGLLGKQSLYEHSMGSPVVLAGPGIEAGAVRHGLGYIHDLFPTICAAASAVPPPGVEAVDLSDLLAGATEGRTELLTIYAGTQRAVRDGRYKLIRLPQIDRCLLFDLQQDPHECWDLAQSPAHQATLHRLRDRMGELQAAAADNLPWQVETPMPAYRDMSGVARRPDRWQPQWIRNKYFR